MSRGDRSVDTHVVGAGDHRIRRACRARGSVGSRSEGIYFAASSFATKAISGFGVVISGAVVDLAGIQRGATVETIAPESLRTLAMAMGPGVLILISITALVATFYDLSNAEHSRIRALLDTNKNGP